MGAGAGCGCGMGFGVAGFGDGFGTVPGWGGGLAGLDGAGELGLFGVGCAG